MFARSRIAFTAVLLTAILSACGEAGMRGSMGRDSAGVKIITSASVGSWAASDKPQFSEFLRIGGLDADSNSQFAAIAAIDMGTDGSVYVLDQQDQVIRAFDASGKFVRRIGRKGTGPGELKTATALFNTVGDTLVVADMVAYTVTRFGTDGSVRGELSTPITEGQPVKWIERNDGTLVVQVRQLDLSGLLGGRAGRAGAEGPADGPAPPDILVVRSASGVVIDTLIKLPGGETLKMGGASGVSVRLFAPEPMWTVSQDGEVFYGLNDEYNIRAYDAAGVLKRIVRKKIERKPVTDEAKTAIKAALGKAMQQALASRGGSATPARLEMMLGVIGFADYFPAIGNLLSGPNGTLWVQQARSAEELVELASSSEMQDIGSSKWDVYNNQGQLLGDIQMPAEFTPLRWIGDKLAGVQSDANGIPSVMILKVSGL